MNITKKKEDLPLIMTRALESNLKPLGEWVYGTLNKNRSCGNITFKNQKAFNGYKGKKLDLSKKLI